MSKRKLRPDELELWQQVARKTERLQGRPEHISGDKWERSKPSKPSPAPEVYAAPIDQSVPVKPKFQIGQKSQAGTRVDAPKSAADRISGHKLGMDAKTFTKMKRGKLSPEARLDLHGMTLDQAHAALNRFILSGQSRGLRLVLVITGKGGSEDPYDPAPRPRGVLKRQVPQWLHMAPLSGAILQIAEANRSHGGSGAYYVYLTRLRKHR